jgi:hypothetical protein
MRLKMLSRRVMWCSPNVNSHCVKRRLALWALFVVALLLLLISLASAEICRYYPEPEKVQRKDGFRWHSRQVDGKRCWYYSHRVLQSVDLIWAFDESEFNSDIDRVIERKFYPRQID